MKGSTFSSTNTSKTPKYSHISIFKGIDYFNLFKCFAEKYLYKINLMIQNSIRLLMQIQTKCQIEKKKWMGEEEHGILKCF